MTSTWIYGRGTDVVMAWCWVPVFATTWLLAELGSAAGDSAVTAVLAVVLLVSLIHQPLTLLLVYGDPDQFAQRRRLFVWTPLVAVPVLAVAVLADLWLIVPVAAVWQLLHTQQQRYGILRIYARKAGYGRVGLDRAATYVPFVAMLVAVGALPVSAAQLERFGRSLGTGSLSAVEGLLAARQVLGTVLVPLVVLTVGIVVAYARQEVRARPANPAKWNHLLATTALLACVLINPVAGLAAYVAAHAVEYTIIVHRTLVARYDGGAAGARGLLATVASTAVGRVGVLVGVLVLLAVVDLQLRDALPARAYLITIYTVGLLHFVYDAVIWKARRPSVAADFGIGPAEATVPGRSDRPLPAP